jgi:hypothetical protein
MTMIYQLENFSSRKEIIKEEPNINSGVKNYNNRNENFTRKMNCQI